MSLNKLEQTILNHKTEGLVFMFKATEASRDFILTPPGLCTFVYSLTQ